MSRMVQDLSHVDRTRSGESHGAVSQRPRATQVPDHPGGSLHFDLPDRRITARRPHGLQANPTLSIYSFHWLAAARTRLRRNSILNYSRALRLYILPVLGRTRLRSLARHQAKSFLAHLVEGGIAKNYVKLIYAVLQAMMNAAVDDGMLEANPLGRMGRYTRQMFVGLQQPDHNRAMTQHQLEMFLDAARNNRGHHFPFWFTLARTGMRISEALGLQWDDINFSERTIHIQRAVVEGHVGTTKSGRSRVVDMSLGLAKELKKLCTQSTNGSGWVFTTNDDTPIDVSWARKVFQNTVAEAGLPAGFTPHSLRHTFASLLISHGESPAYVQRQLGHHSVALTVDVYGQWLPFNNKAAVDRLDEPSDSHDISNRQTPPRHGPTDISPPSPAAKNNLLLSKRPSPYSISWLSFPSRSLPDQAVSLADLQPAGEA